ncbi:hypothetical protein BGW36DRAFT_290071 [Talaromyces proteolyticus]|uniref:Uncharacterized protein n=1 Tax=Talaromyces proteolyticus TaxID=1131652 RepID=A0AAD4Q3F8_9EURO|nr:uncharacterized protein BGW36DRAFT_290071 [Talaromyces proteolyticus]KAH8701736.1 hypothetical protein BGW36DRAFT_290071 [Talaromyces proteolyticus]
MFRRRSSSRHQPLNTPSASAQTAASRAFIANREANAALSSAAAAAALRSHTTTPTSVENVQSKRMLQRQLSNSSRGSSAVGTLRGSLHRTPSSGSMSSRTFRENSPGRSQISSGVIAKQPPVPALPQGYSAETNPQARRSFSVQPGRVASPSHKAARGRVTSLDRVPSSAASPPSPRGHAKQNSLELDRPTSRTSINFSYPMHARPNSPPHSPVPNEFTRNSAEQSPTQPLSPEEVAKIQNSVNKAGSLKVKKRPQRSAPGSTEGSHLTHKTMGSRPTGTAVQETPLPNQVETLPPSTKISPLDDTITHSSPVVDDRPQSPVIAAEDSVQTDVDNVRPRPKKRPSTVMEDYEAEEWAEATEVYETTSTKQSVDVPVQSPVQSPTAETANDNQKQRTPNRLAIETLQTTEKKPSYSPVHLSPSTPSSTPSSPSSDRLSAIHNIDRQGLQREPSISPNRSARFSAHLTVSSESPIHEPPPRSMSPAKPALKISSSPDRRLHTALRTGQTPSEISDATSVASDDGSRTGSRKKAVKVSFDDGPEIVGVAASPPTSPEPIDTPPSPTEKTKPRNWFSIGKRKFGFKNAVADDEFESVLKPRPALPSFGSIRGTRETDEPITQIADDNISTSSSEDDTDPRDLGVSSDHALGGILVNALRQPSESTGPKVASDSLPEATSLETKDISQGIDLVDVAMPQHLPTVVEESDSTPTPTPPATSNRPATDSYVDGALEAVPTIAIQPATPGAENRKSLDIQNMPGGFPTSSDRSLSRQDQKITANPVETPRRSSEESDRESEESIYSDAAEDPDDFDGDGFGSINAIVDSPIPAKTESPTQAPESPSPAHISPVAAATVTEHQSPTAPMASPPMFQPIKQEPEPVLAVSKPVEKEAFDPSDPSWPLKPNDSSSTTLSKLNLKSQSQPKTKPKATPVDPHQGSHLRKALDKSEGQRPSPQKRLSTSVQSSISATKHTTPPIATQGPNRVASKKHNNAKTIPQSMTFPGGLSSTNAYDSDSDSSFKRTRRSSRVDGQYSMKRTMRATRPVSMSTADTLGARSTSPRTSSMRMTMRGAPPDRSPSGLASLRSKTPLPRPKSSAMPSSSISRFGGSDDEGQGRRRIFQSRFADSSDEEPLPSNLTPVRGIPRRRGEFDGESTDLEDSSDEESKRARNGNVKPASQMSPAEIDALLSQPRKRGLLARFKSKSKDGKVRKSGLDSAARRDTPLERSRLELAQMRDDAFNGASPQPGRSTSPKLHKKQASPVPPASPLSVTTAPGPTQSRPSTSDGIVHSGFRTDISAGSPSRPSYNRHGTGNSLDSEATQAASDVVVGRTGRKKRFPLLRKAFGLRD